jgi:hypothetical protein
MIQQVALTYITAVLLLVSSSGTGAAAQKRHGHVHVHGAAEVNIAVEGTKATVEIRAPGESIMGFEHEAKSEGDKKKRDAALTRLEQRRDDIVIFDAKLGCKSSEMKTALVQEGSGSAGKHEHTKGQKTGEHREVHANYSVSCDKPLTGSRVRFGFTKAFPQVHEVKVQVVGDAKQTGATIKKDKGDVAL